MRHGPWLSQQGREHSESGNAAGRTVCYRANTDTVLDLVLHQTPPSAHLLKNDSKYG